MGEDRLKDLVKDLLEHYFGDYCQWNCTFNKAAEDIAEQCNRVVRAEHADLVVVYKDDIGTHVVKPNNDWYVKDFVHDLMMNGVDHIEITCVKELKL